MLMMDARRSLWLMALIFSVVLLVQHFELPLGYLLSSLLSFGNSHISSVGSFRASGSSSSMYSSGFNSTYNMSASHKVLNMTQFSPAHEELHSKSSIDKHSIARPGFDNHRKDNTPSRDSLELNSSADEKVVRNNSLPPKKADENGHNLRSSSDASAVNSSSSDLWVRAHAAESETFAASATHVASSDASFPPLMSPSRVIPPDNKGANDSSHAQSPTTSPSLRGKDGENNLINSGEHGLLQSNAHTFANNFSINTTSSKNKIKGPPAVVVPISVMNDMLLQSRVLYRFVRPHWASQADLQLTHAKAMIEKAEITKMSSDVAVNVYRNFSAFMRSYELMEQTLKVYIYTEGKKPIFHQPEFSGIYASEGWFMKQLKENKHFVTKNADEAHLFYLPFSSRLLEATLYVPDSHSRKNLVQYLSNYLQTIKTAHRFWNRTDGADHFLVACHDWAPSETSRIMKNCIRALCNAEVERGFQFGKDVSLPETYVRYPLNPLKGRGGKPPSQRKILAFFAGQMHGYLRPILVKYWENKDPDMKIFAKLQDGKGRMSYIQYMKTSKYCISAKGYEPYTPRVVEAIFYECVPVIISDNYVPPFFEILNWESFAIFVLEKDIPNLKKILESVPEKRYLEMQERVRQVQKHFLWHNTAEKYDVFHMILHSIWYTRVFQIRPG